MRSEVLTALANNEKIVVVSFPEAIAEKVIRKEALLKSTLTLHVGEQVTIDFIQEVMQEYHFQYVDFVFEPGQYSIRGSIIDIFSFASDVPFRIDFFGDEVESIRSFDIETQLSKNQFSNISIIPKIINPVAENKELKQTESIFSFFPDNTIIWAEDTLFIIDKILDVYNKMSENGSADITISDQPFKNAILHFPFIELGNPFICSEHIIQFNISHQPLFNKNFELLGKNLVENTDKGYTNFILSDNEKQIDRLKSIFTDINPAIQFTPVLQTIHEGFIDHELKICFYTDHQIFGRYHKFRIKSSLSEKESLNFRDLTSLHPGDYVVHIDHGIGKFGGLKKLKLMAGIRKPLSLFTKI
jgi:transcription-repair coupling factor (superfamily II helicase)